MTFLADLRAGDARLGGKARSLAELALAGLPTPVGFVVSDDLFRALCLDVPDFDRLDEDALVLLDRLREQIRRAPWPRGFHDELAGRLANLSAASFAVRSSFANEDRPGRLAAGVYESRVDVPVASVEQAIRDVLCSALAPGAVAYALAHGDAPGRGPFAVLVHVYLAGAAEGSAALVPGEQGSAAEPLVTIRRGSLPADSRARLGVALVRLAASIGPVEVEWVLRENQLVYVQARPYQAPLPLATWAGWAELGDGEAREPWRWDAAHNPLPLSPAQAGLVEMVDRECSVGTRQRVLGGYLFCARDERAARLGLASDGAEEFFSSLRAGVESRLAALGEKPGLEPALEVFLFAYQQIFGVLQPALREAGNRLAEFLATHAPAKLALLAVLRAGVPSVASERLAACGRIASASCRQDRALALAEYLARFGDEAAVWDVAFSTYAEEPAWLLSRPVNGQPSSLDWRRASSEVDGTLATMTLRRQWRGLLDVARVAVALAEADDWLYARAQAAVRRGLLALGERLASDGILATPTDVFYVPLPLMRGIAGGAPPPPGLASVAAEGRRMVQEAVGNPPPSGGDLGSGAVAGSGVGGRAIGRVFRHRSDGKRPFDPTGVLLARTILPTELPLLVAAAIVTETGGPLDHVAAQARERGIPAVVGAQGALAALAEGELVLVDGERGLVVRLGPRLGPR